MQLSEITYHDHAPISGYGAGFFRVGEMRHDGAVLVTPAAVAPWSGYDDIDSLLKLAGDVDVLFVGTGAEIAHLPAGLRDQLEEAGLGVEVMNSPSACRTYNVLLSEGRRIAAALIPV